MMYPLNYLGIVVTALVIFAIGAPGTACSSAGQWMAAQRLHPGAARGHEAGDGPYYFPVLPVLSAAGGVMDYLIVRLGIDTPQGGEAGGYPLGGLRRHGGFTAYLYPKRSSRPGCWTRPITGVSWWRRGFCSPSGRGRQPSTVNSQRSTDVPAGHVPFTVPVDR